MIDGNWRRDCQFLIHSSVPFAFWALFVLRRQNGHLRMQAPNLVPCQKTKFTRILAQDLTITTPDWIYLSAQDNLTDSKMIVPGLDKGDWLPFYLFVSNEALLIQRELKRFKNEIIQEGLRAFNLDVMDGKGLVAEKLISVARTLPMMGPKRVIVVEDFEKIQSKELIMLLEYFKSPSPETIVCASSKKIDTRIKFFAQAKKHGWIFELGGPKNVNAWLANEVSAKQMDVNPQAQRRLAEVVGADLSRLLTSLDQLALYCNERPVLPEDVDTLIANTSEKTVFELIDALNLGQTARVLAISNKLVAAKQSVIGILVMLARHIRQLGLCFVGQHQGLKSGDLAQKIGIPPFVVSKLIKACDAFSPRSIPKMSLAIHSADIRLKGHGGLSKSLGRTLQERVVLETLLLDLLSCNRLSA